MLSIIRRKVAFVNRDMYQICSWIGILETTMDKWTYISLAVCNLWSPFDHNGTIMLIFVCSTNWKRIWWLCIFGSHSPPTLEWTCVFSMQFTLSGWSMCLASRLSFPRSTTLFHPTASSICYLSFRYFFSLDHIFIWPLVNGSNR